MSEDIDLRAVMGDYVGAFEFGERKSAEPGSVCPTCDRRVPVPREVTTPRKRGQVNISTPKDVEDGAEVLRALIDAARLKLIESGAFSYDKDCPPYYVLVAVLHDWLTNG